MAWRPNSRSTRTAPAARPPPDASRSWRHVLPRWRRSSSSSAAAASGRPPRSPRGRPSPIRRSRAARAAAGTAPRPAARPRRRAGSTRSTRPRCRAPARPAGAATSRPHPRRTTVPGRDPAPRPVHRRFDVRVGRCRRCGRRVQGRHPLQTSDALGAAASQLGPDAQALAVHLNKRAGLSHGKVARFFEDVFGIGLSRGGSCHAVLRAGRRCEGNYAAITARVRSSDRVVPDETGWRVGGLSAWLHAAATPHAVAYLVDPRRGSEATGKLLGEGYAGTLTRDGWAAYGRLWRAAHQLCLAHLLRRCRELLQAATRGAVLFPRKVKALLKEALAVRDARDAGRVSARRAGARADALQGRMDELLRPAKSHRANETFARHLWANRRHLFTFLRRPGVDATNWRAEQALRPAVVNRKVWGGNRTWAGARAQSVLMTVLQTAHLLGRDSMHFLSRLLCAPAEQQPLLVTA
ncbi:MAG TPA: IS66 family transposase [Longimicrobiaceae bacterium]|nr:IS66 family transposase [Longimicrobiaceae bacterium]